MKYTCGLAIILGFSISDVAGIGASSDSHHLGLNPEMHGNSLQPSGSSEDVDQVEQMQFEADLDHMEGLLHSSDDTSDSAASQRAPKKTLPQLQKDLHRNMSTHLAASAGSIGRVGSVPAMPGLGAAKAKPLKTIANANQGGLIRGQTAEQLRQTLLGMKGQKQCKSDKLGGFVEDIEAIVATEVQPRIEEQHKNAQEILDSVAQGLQGCVESRSSLDGEIGTLYNSINTRRTSHTTCRSTEETTTQATETCETTRTLHEQTMATECSWSFLCTGSSWHGNSGWNCNSPEPPSITDIDDQCHTSDSEDYGSRLVRMKDWFDEKLEQFATREVNCNTATGNYQETVQECETALATSTAQTTNCDTQQTQFETSVCAHEQAESQQCITYKACYDGAMNTYNTQKQSIQQQEIAWKLEWVTVLRVQCYLAEFKTSGCEADPEKIQACDAQSEDTTHLDLNYPEGPGAPDSCEAQGPDPCSSEFQNSEYAMLPANTHAVACTPCAFGSAQEAGGNEPEPEIGQCTRPDGWCTHDTAGYFELDCDGDGIADPYCRDTQGQTGSRSSSTDCTESWPQGACQVCVVTLFQHSDGQGGWHAFLPEGSYDHNQMAQAGAQNDDLSSLRVPAGCKAIVYEHGSFDGWSVTFDAGVYDYAAMTAKGCHNDAVSSVEVLRA